MPRAPIKAFGLGLVVAKGLLVIHFLFWTWQFFLFSHPEQQAIVSDREMKRRMKNKYR